MLIDKLAEIELTGFEEFEDEAKQARVDTMHAMEEAHAQKFADEAERARIKAEQEEAAAQLKAARLELEKARAEQEAIAKANNTPYGLSAGIWSDKGSRILAVADKLRAGVIWANTFNKFDPSSPFGGYKESGYGREGGLHGLAAYLKPGAASGSTISATVSESASSRKKAAK